MPSFYIDDASLRRAFTEQVLGALSPAEFERLVGGGELTGSQLTKIAFRRAWEEQDPWLASVAVSFGHLWGVSGMDESVFADLMLADWHRSHEDLLQLVSKVITPEVVLRCAVTAATSPPTYLDAVDQGRALKRWSAFVLSQLETPASKAELDRFAVALDPALRRYAREAKRRAGRR